MVRSITWLHGAAWLLAGLLCLPVAAEALQSSGAPLSSRDALAARADSLRNLAESSSDQGEIYRALERASAIEDRLEQGDFKSGDIIELTTVGDEALTGTFNLDERRVLELPTVPPIDMSGVLYSETESYLKEKLGVYVRNQARIRVKPMLRLAVTGAVNSPGYYSLAPSTSVSEAIMEAGGPTARARLSDVEYRRDGRDLLRRVPDSEGPHLSLMELGTVRGDQIYVPERGQGISLRNAAYVAGAVMSLTTFAVALF